MQNEETSYLLGWLYNFKSEPAPSSFTINLNFQKILSDKAMIQMASRFSATTFEELEYTFQLDFARGYFDRVGIVDIYKYVKLPCNDLTFQIVKVLDLPFETNGQFVLLEGVNGLEFLAKIYKNGQEIQFCSLINRSIFVSWCNPNRLFEVDMASFKFKKAFPDAVSPAKNKFSDSGFDLTLVRLNNVASGVYYYDTGISVEPPPGFYFELVPRSSMSKSGYILANSVGIIDASYRGTIIVALIKIGDASQDICLPAKMVQIIPRKLNLLRAVEAVEELTATARNEGSFGSSS